MWAGHNLSMGRGSTIAQRCYIDARGGIRVEPEVSISREVLGVNSRIYGTTGRRQRSLVVVGFRWCLVPA